MALRDFTQFEMRIPINAPKEEIYRAIATREGLEKWFLREAVFTSTTGVQRPPSEMVAQTDTYEWRWFGWPDEVQETGEIQKADNASFLQFVFGSAGIVSFTVREELDTHVVELKQTQIPENEDAFTNFYLGCSKGWLFYLTNLKSILEGGIDLRNKNVLMKNVVNS